MDLTYIGMVALLVFGFGFVIFWHELGHFLAAKWAGVKVDQFAVGFGQAAVSFRKGLGVRLGSSAKEYQRRIHAHLHAADPAQAPLDESFNHHTVAAEQAGQALGLGETEYRLNWIPLGGYVKMVGQDDLDPAAQSDSPRAYNNRPIYKRMIIVSAGVIMNMILAVLLFTLLFRIGFHVPPALVGGVVPGSPAQAAGLEAGDRILAINGSEQHDFNKVMMSVALLEADKPVPVMVQTVGGETRTVDIAPQHMPDDPGKFLKLGIEAAGELRGPDPKTLPKDWDKDKSLLKPEMFLVGPGETIVTVAGQPVDDPKKFYILNEALQHSGGKPIELTIKAIDGKVRDAQIKPIFRDPFGADSLNFAGLAPRTEVDGFAEGSAAIGKLAIGDAIVSISDNGGEKWQPGPSPHDFVKMISQVGDGGYALSVIVERAGAVLPPVSGLLASTKLESGARGLGISIAYDADHAVVGEVLPDSTAAKAQVPVGARILTFNGQTVANWYDVLNAIKALPHPQAVPVSYSVADKATTTTFELTAADLQRAANNRYASDLVLHPYEEIRKTTSPIEAAKWGVAETRDLTLQFYLMLHRMFQGSVSPKNAIGPYGIFKYGSAFAQRGIDWLIWFLAMISANLAVVNFLPIPIVDGGLFLFLLLEKAMGRPLSAKAQSIAQIAGLCLIGTVFLFVTYNDITR